MCKKTPMGTLSGKDDCVMGVGSGGLNGGRLQEKANGSGCGETMPLCAMITPPRGASKERVRGMGSFVLLLTGGFLFENSRKGPKNGSKGGCLNPSGAAMTGLLTTAIWLRYHLWRSGGGGHGSGLG